MKLQGAEASRYLTRPDPKAAGLLIFGADAMRVALKRQAVIAALVGPEGEVEMRLTRIPAAELRRDPALLLDAVKAQGFFPGSRVAFVEDAGDGLAAVITSALRDWRAGDAQIVVTAGNLTAKSPLRKVFEAHPSAPAIGIYDDPPTREEFEADLTRAGLRAIAPEAMTDLEALSRELDPGDFRQTMEKIGLYKFGDDTPLTPTDVAACAPMTIEADVEDVVHAAAEGRMQEVGALMPRLTGQGVAPVTLAIRTLQHFRTLHAIAVQPGNGGQALMRLPYKARDRMARQSRAWGVARLEEALMLVVETDLTLRSASKAPAMALTERMLLRLAGLASRR